MNLDIKHINNLGKNPLFKDVTRDETLIMLDCLGAVKKAYEKNQYVLHSESQKEKMGIVLEGSVHLVKEDYWGNRTILSKSGPGELFGESFPWSASQPLPISVIATEATQIIFISYKRLTTTCTRACPYHTRLINNMMEILVERNIQLTEKIDLLVQRSTRDKILSYLSAQALLLNGNSFFIPFDRQELADYLAVERSAMSKELSRMKEEGILDYKKNWFRLHQRGKV